MENTSVTKNQEIIDVPIWKRKRYLVGLLAFFGLFNVYALRVNLSVAIIPMSEHFGWDSKQNGLVLSSFYYGYLVTQIIGGVWAKKFGGNVLFGVGIFATALITLLTPLAASWSIYAMVAVRVIIGLFEGVTYSSLIEMFSRWAPPFERSRMVALAFTGNYAGIVASMPLSGVLATQLGWESVFYFFGALGCIWFLIWISIVRKSPQDDKLISEQEKIFILASLEQQADGKKIPIPWKSIFTSAAVWAIVAAQFSEGWGFFTLQTQLPQFLNDVLKFDLTKSGFVSAIPYLIMCIMLQIAGYLADWVQIKKILTTKQTRKYFNTLAFISQAISLLLAVYILSPVFSVFFISVGVAMAAFAYTSFSVNYLDIAPQFAGILMGICNSAATIGGIISPLLTGYIVQNKAESEWKIVFYIAGGIYVFGCIVYWCFCEGTVQPWALEQPLTKEQKDTSKHAYHNEALEP